MDLLLEPFAAGFTQRALVAGLLVAATCATVGVWVVLRSLAFLGDALAHGVIPGIAVAALLGGDLTIGAAVSAAITVGGISLVTNRTGLSEDTSTGLLFAGMLSLGVLIISSGASFQRDVTVFLFGDILGVTTTDLQLQAIAAITALTVSVVLYRPFVALAFDQRKAQLLGMHPRLARGALLGLIGLVVVTAFRTVGSLLVFGLMVAPAATATLLVRRVPVVMIVSLALGMSSVVIGLEVSYHLDLAGSAAISAAAVAQFFVVLVVRTLWEPFRSRRMTPAADRA